MRRCASFLAGLVVLGLLLPTFAALQDVEKKKTDEPKTEVKDKTDKKKPDEPKTDSKEKTEKKDKDKAEPPEKPAAKEKNEPKEKLTSLGKIQGRLIRLDVTQRIFTVKVTSVVPRPQINNNRITYQAHRVERDVQFIPHDDLKVRSVQPPVMFDDKGNRRALTQKEKLELRGSDPKLPGYAVEFDALKQEQIVEVQLATRKTPAELRALARGGASKVKTKTKGSEADEALENLGDDKPLATVILILAEPVK